MTEYNTSRNPLLIREYGRNVQKMVEHLLLIDDYDLRTEGAKAVIKMMSQINPEAKNSKEKDTLDYWHKLWDHLFIISDYRLDVASPFPKPERKQSTTDTPVFQYRKAKISNRTYGRNIENVIKAVASYPDSPHKTKLTQNLANYLKRLYLTWNRDSVDDKLILNQLKELSEGKLELDSEFKLDSTNNILQQANPQQKKVLGQNNAKRKKKKKKKKKEEL
ncbi:MAG: DUF4290 domain-containing protein [Bacteroidales bacterium]|nr:DUF4290 domain-containing protein [Bacteroidales bacterium]